MHSLKRYDLPLIQNPGQTVKETIELDKGTILVSGFLIASDRDDMLFHRGSLEAHLSGCENWGRSYRTY